eukprot:CAMPEP_0173180730 /NCGR_PEP_ID=MMETSP1141-20130122/6878_1 /TAXON_ID=483371 /ORGANISM="non described non described, Strain CCMP2298" /LENGTH=816 /DNA_ID=CAMNT_0014103613 /DNA_START=2537 /DNA_END=4984 /DNA_ORIENTATION=+
MLTQLFSDLHEELLAYVGGTVRVPSKQWTAVQVVSFLRLYPAGLSRSVLMTELELAWKSSSRRGDHAGRLQQAVAVKQLGAGDVLSGTLSRLDEFRCLLSDEGASCAMIMHQQWFDWVHFLDCKGADAASLRCSFTQCRMLTSPAAPLLLLPTPLLVFQLNARIPAESSLLNVLAPLHASFLQLYVLPQGPQPDNCGTHVVLTEVLGVGPVRTRPTPGLSQDESQSQSHSEFRLVSLRVQGPGLVVLYLLLLDRQVALSALWGAGDALLFYRPYLRSNREDPLWGWRDAPEDAGLSEFLPPQAVPLFPAFHLLYGSITIVAKVQGLATTAASAPIADPFSIPAPASAVGAGAAGRGNTQGCIEAGARNASVCGRLLAVREGRVSLGGAPVSVLELWLHHSPYHASAQGGQQEGKQGQGQQGQGQEGEGQLLCVRCLGSEFPALVPSLVQTASGPHCYPASGCQPGQLLQLAGLGCLGTRLLHESTLAQVLATQAQTQMQGQAQLQVQAHDRIDLQLGVPPVSVARYLQQHQWTKGVLVADCVLGGGSPDTASALFPLPILSDDARGMGRSQPQPQPQSAAASLPLCRLAALTGSPSLLKPQHLASLPMLRAADAGCVLVLAQLQQLHPNVRLAVGAAAVLAGTGGVPGNPNPGKRRYPEGDSLSAPLSAGSEESVTGAVQVLGYQMVRLRDSSGEVLCVIESDVTLGQGQGQGAGQGLSIQRVAHRLVSTSVQLGLDQHSGVLRVHTPAMHTHAPRAPTLATAPGATAVPAQEQRSQGSGGGGGGGGSGGAVSPQAPQYCLLLSRIDDVDCLVLEA